MTTIKIEKYKKYEIEFDSEKQKFIAMLEGDKFFEDRDIVKLKRKIDSEMFSGENVEALLTTDDRFDDTPIKMEVVKITSAKIYRGDLDDVWVKKADESRVMASQWRLYENTINNQTLLNKIVELSKQKLSIEKEIRKLNGKLTKLTPKHLGFEVVV